MAELSTFKKIEALGRRYKKVTFIEWKDAHSWRGGLDWWDEDDYELVVEKKTLKEVVNAMHDYMEQYG